MVSRNGFPLSNVSATARRSRFCSIRSAIRNKTAERSATEVSAQPLKAACAASNAKFTSSASERATSQKACPVMGVIFSK